MKAKIEITTEELCHFFSVRSPGFVGTLAAGEFPAALESFAPIPCRILAGNIPVVRYERDVDWEGNLYEVYQLPVDSTGCLLERHSVSSIWRFRGIGGDLWEVESPERWRVLNAFAGEQRGMANSQFGRHSPSLWPWWSGLECEAGDNECVPVGDLSTAAAAATMGRKGGKSRSPAKTAAVRENGRKRTTKLRALITQHGWLPGQDVEQWIGFSDLIAESTARKYEKKGWLKNIGHRVLTQEGYRNA